MAAIAVTVRLHSKKHHGQGYDHRCIAEGHAVFDVDHSAILDGY